MALPVIEWRGKTSKKALTYNAVIVVIVVL